MNFQWYAGNLACKGLMMVRTGGYILSSLMLIVLSIDRSKMISIIIITIPHGAIARFLQGMFSANHFRFNLLGSVCTKMLG